jgi:hypothetical protein
MDPELLGPEESYLQRARLHIRGGRRRLRQGKKEEGLVTIYDALTSGVDWYLESPRRREAIRSAGEEDLRGDGARYALLVRAGVLDGTFDFEGFDRLVDRTLAGDAVAWDETKVMAGLESVMTQLGVMPFEESGLPPEDPDTF